MLVPLVPRAGPGPGKLPAEVIVALLTTPPETPSVSTMPYGKKQTLVPAVQPDVPPLTIVIATAFRVGFTSTGQPPVGYSALIAANVPPVPCVTVGT